MCQGWGRPERQLCQARPTPAAEEWGASEHNWQTGWAHACQGLPFQGREGRAELRQREGRAGRAGQKNIAGLKGQLELPNESQGCSRGLSACSAPCCQFQPRSLHPGGPRLALPETWPHRADLLRVSPATACQGLPGLHPPGLSLGCLLVLPPLHSQHLPCAQTQPSGLCEHFKCYFPVLDRPDAPTFPV